MGAAEKVLGSIALIASFALLAIFIENAIPFITTLFIAMIIHETAHYITAKKQGIYEDWGLLPTPHIKQTHACKSRWSYLNGILASYITLPLWIWWVKTDIPTALLLLTVIGIGDLIPVIFWKYVKKEWQKDSKTLQTQTPAASDANTNGKNMMRKK